LASVQRLLERAFGLAHGLEEERSMKVAALLLLLSGWLIVLSAVPMLRGSSRAGFVYAGFAVELLGLVLLFRAHMTPQGDQSQGER
jgi:hypothetical protein